MPFEQDPTTRVAAPRGLRLFSIDLVVVDGPSRGLRASVKTGTARVGAAPGNDLALADPTVSRVHCELSLRGDAVVVRDAGSTNGTWVEGVRIERGEVKPGTLVRVGSSAFRIDLGDEPSFVEVSDKRELGELVGASVEMRRLYAIVERVAPTDATVLVGGETGTGKDVVARTLHALSKRAAGPFVAVDCGAIPESLIESELFGHVRGAFTGAQSDRRGVFEEADGGTLFLDEIGEMPLALQPKLLRAIESRTVRRLGAARPTPIDVRIVAATNRPLARAVNDGIFREDLYYRLAVVEIALPPLRTRREDIPLLARRFLEKNGFPGEPPEPLLAQLASRPFPGNVRELKNFIERAVSLGLVGLSGGAPRPSPPARPLEQVVPLHLPLKEARQAWTESFESVYVREMLKKVGGNVTRAAELAGVSRRFLQRTIARLGIKPQEVGSSAEDFDDGDGA